MSIMTTVTTTMPADDVAGQIVDYALSEGSGWVLTAQGRGDAGSVATWWDVPSTGFAVITVQRSDWFNDVFTFSPDGLSEAKGKWDLLRRRFANGLK
ncbi:hypothetical protein ACN20G_29805 (plasmid) [Streptomyces sp. BI20]|uniref:hypothetical protein n=1 Tax=Streptomyces sp. BI20 TaxID=3403460 RepID=UPI003C7968C2